MKYWTAIITISVAAIISSCSRDPFQTFDLFEQSIKSGDCEDTIRVFAQESAPSCDEVRMALESLETGFGSLDFETLRQPRVENANNIVAQFGHGQDFKEFFARSIRGSNEIEGEVKIYYCYSSGFKPCLIVFATY